MAEQPIATADQTKAGPLKLQVETAAAEPVEVTASLWNGEISGTILDETGAPVAGLEIQAHWPRADEFGQPFMHHFAWNSYMAAEMFDRFDPMRGRVSSSRAFTGEDGHYVLSGLPDHVRLHIPTDRYDIEPWPNFAMAGELHDWTATRLRVVRVELLYAGELPAGTRVSAWQGKYSGHHADAKGRFAIVAARPGMNAFHARSYEYGLVSPSIDVFVNDDAPLVQLQLSEVPRLEIALAFADARLQSAFEVQSSSLEGTRPERLVHWTGQSIWTLAPAAVGVHRIAVVAGKREIASGTFNYTGGRQRFELVVPAPEDYCTVTSNAKPPATGETVVFSYPGNGAAPIVWQTLDERWLVQPAANTSGTQDGLSMYHSAWGQVHAEGPVDVGGAVHFAFQRPARLRFVLNNCPDRLALSLSLDCLDEAQQRTPARWYTTGETVVQPGRWTLKLSSSLVPGTEIDSRAIELRPGEQETVTFDLNYLKAVKVRTPADAPVAT